MTEPTDEDLVHARTLWDYHRLDDPIVPSDVIIGLGSHDISVAEHSARLWHQGASPTIVFTGANAPTTVDVFPNGEAAHYRQRAMALGVPEGAIMIEDRATNTAENVDLSRELLSAAGIPIKSALIVTRPYQQRRARATFRRRWPELEAIYSSAPFGFDEYLVAIGDTERVVNMLVGDTQRIALYARRGFAEAEPMDASVEHAFAQLVMAGYVARIAG